MNKTVIWVVVIIAAAAVAALYVWSSQNRYYIMTSSNGRAYEVDRKTGKSWTLRRGEKIAHESPDVDMERERPLPSAEQAKVTGNAELSRYGSLSGELYNGSSWTITRMVINVTAKEKNGLVRWTRDFSERMKIGPLEAGSFSVILAGAQGLKNAPWNIKEIYGYQE